MLYLILAILTSTAILVLFKLFPRYRIQLLQAITVNYITATSLGFFIERNNPQIASITQQEWLPFAILIGCVFIFTFQLFAFSSQTAGVAITAVSSKISVVIPVLVGVLIYANETLSVFKIIGLILAIVSFLLVFNNNANMKINPRFIFLPIILFLVNGFNDTLMTYSQRTHAGENTMIFIACIFFTSMVIGLIWVSLKLIIFKEKILLRNIIAGILLGIFNFLSTYYFFKGVDKMESAVFFPVLNTGIVVLSALSGIVFFKEKFNLINWIGIVTAIATIILIAIS